MEPKFKKGDRIKPSKKGTSNYHHLKDLIELEVINNDLNPSFSKKLIKVKILKGSTYDNLSWSFKYCGDSLNVFQNAFELLIPEEDNYEIY
jgi:hypothetical protein